MPRFTKWHLVATIIIPIDTNLDKKDRMIDTHYNRLFIEFYFAPLASLNQLMLFLEKDTIWKVFVNESKWSHVMSRLSADTPTLHLAFNFMNENIHS